MRWKFQIVLGFKSGTALFFAFLASFFSFAGNLIGFILVAKVFTKALRILELDGRKCRRVVEQDFHGNFLDNVTFFFFAFFSGVLNWIELILVWFERSFHLTQARLTIKTDDITSDRRDVIRAARTVTSHADVLRGSSRVPWGKNAWRTPRNVCVGGYTHGRLGEGDSGANGLNV